MITPLFACAVTGVPSYMVPFTPVTLPSSTISSSAVVRSMILLEAAVSAVASRVFMGAWK